MASFCSKCGAELSPAAQSCTVCGTPVAAAAPAAAPTQPVAAPVQPATAPTQPVAAPVKSGSALKIILIVLAVFVGLGIIGAGAFGYMVWRVAHSVHVSGSGDQVTVNSGGGTFSANTSQTFSASDLGTEIYPGAQPGKGSMRMTLPTGTVITAIYVTSDSKDQVISFYKSKFGSDASVIETPEGAIVSLKKGEQESVMVTITANSSEYDGKTQITIVHNTSTKPS